MTKKVNIPDDLESRGEEIWNRMEDVLSEYDLEDYRLSMVKLERKEPGVEFICFDCCPLRIYLC